MSLLRRALSITSQERAAKLGEPIIVQGRSDAGRQRVVEVEIVRGQKPGGQDLVALIEVTEVGGGVVAAGEAIAAGVERAEVVGAEVERLGGVVLLAEATLQTFDERVDVGNGRFSSRSGALRPRRSMTTPDSGPGTRVQGQKRCVSSRKHRRRRGRVGG